jgi:hypothetical protein
VLGVATITFATTGQGLANRGGGAIAREPAAAAVAMPAGTSFAPQVTAYLVSTEEQARRLRAEIDETNARFVLSPPLVASILVVEGHEDAAEVIAGLDGAQAFAEQASYDVVRTVDLRGTQ